MKRLYHTILGSVGDEDMYLIISPAGTIGGISFDAAIERRLMMERRPGFVVGPDSDVETGAWFDGTRVNVERNWLPSRSVQRFRWGQLWKVECFRRIFSGLDLSMPVSSSGMAYRNEWRRGWSSGVNCKDHCDDCYLTSGTGQSIW